MFAYGFIIFFFSAVVNAQCEDSHSVIDFLQRRRGYEGFLAKAPEAVVQGQREAAARLKEKIEMLDEEIAKLN